MQSLHHFHFTKISPKMTSCHDSIVQTSVSNSKKIILKEPSHSNPRNISSSLCVFCTSSRTEIHTRRVVPIRLKHDSLPNVLSLFLLPCTIQHIVCRIASYSHFDDSNLFKTETEIQIIIIKTSMRRCMAFSTLYFMVIVASMALIRSPVFWKKKHYTGFRPDS